MFELKIMNEKLTINVFVECKTRLTAPWTSGVGQSSSAWNCGTNDIGDLENEIIIFDLTNNLTLHRRIYKFKICNKSVTPEIAATP